MYACNSHSYTHLKLALGIVRKPRVWVFITSKYPGIHDIGRAIYRYTLHAASVWCVRNGKVATSANIASRVAVVRARRVGVARAQVVREAESNLLHDRDCDKTWMGQMRGHGIEFTSMEHMLTEAKTSNMYPDFNVYFTPVCRVSTLISA